MSVFELKSQIQSWSLELGFAECSISDIHLDAYKPKLKQWLEAGYQGQMLWMANSVDYRCDPQLLWPETLSIISVRMNYLPPGTEPLAILESKDKAYISRYALGRDYHKLMRKRLAQLAAKMHDWMADHADYKNPLRLRPFVDSAPVLEKPLAAKAGLGWIGKNTLLLNKQQGSWFFLGELFTNLPLPADTPVDNHCGSCKACLNICPTKAFPAPYVLDARKCISYLTIESREPIPVELREPMGNRVFGCDDCQLVCPWNRYSQFSDSTDFQPRHQLHDIELIDLFQWSEAEYLKKTAGSAIRRAGYQGWKRNLAVGIGNGSPNKTALNALYQSLQQGQSALLSEHIEWAIQRLESQGNEASRA